MQFLIFLDGRLQRLASKVSSIRSS